MTPKVIAFAGWSGAGKTTLIERLIPWFCAGGQRVSVLKHAHHQFDIDRPGKDSWRHREAGATEVLITATGRWALLHELRDEPEPTLEAQLARLSPCDLVLIEGYRSTALPKIAVHHAGSERPLRLDPSVLALVSDAAPEQLPGVEGWIASGRGRWFSRDDIAGIGCFIQGLPANFQDLCAKSQDLPGKSQDLPAN